MTAAFRIAAPLALGLALAGCADPAGTAPARMGRPDPASGLIPAQRSDGSAPTSFGVAPGNIRSATQSLAEAAPARIAPLFRPFKAERAASAAPQDYALVMGTGNADTWSTVQAAAANICAAIGTAAGTATELPRSKDGVRQISVTCR